MLKRIRTLLDRRQESGATAVEYALLIAGIAIVVIVAIFFLGTTVSQSYSNVGSSISNAG